MQLHQLPHQQVHRLLHQQLHHQIHHMISPLQRINNNRDRYRLLMSIGKAVMQIVLIVFLSSALIIGSMARVRAAQECTLDQSNQAEQTIGGLSTWDQVFVSFKYYKQCDDGAVAEGYDDKIVSLLV